MDSLRTLYLKLPGLVDIQKFYWKNKDEKWKQRCSFQKGSWSPIFISKEYFQWAFYSLEVDNLIMKYACNTALFLPGIKVDII